MNVSRSKITFELDHPVIEFFLYVASIEEYKLDTFRITSGHEMFYEMVVLCVTGKVSTKINTKLIQRPKFELLSSFHLQFIVMMAGECPANVSLKMIALTPRIRRVIWRLLNSKLCSQILWFATIQTFQYNLLTYISFIQHSPFLVKRRKVLCKNSCYPVKDYN